MEDQNEKTFGQIRKEFLTFLKYTKGHSDAICYNYNYNSDLGIWQRWLEGGGLDWQRCKPAAAENFLQHLAKNKVGPMRLHERSPAWRLFTNGESATT